MTCWCYIIECQNGEQYTGITKDLSKRYKQHKSGRGALYTKLNKVKRLLYAIELPTRSDARKLEIKLKKISRMKRGLFIKNNSCSYLKTNEFGEQKLLHCFLSVTSFIAGVNTYGSWIKFEPLTPLQNVPETRLST